MLGPTLCANSDREDSRTPLPVPLSGILTEDADQTCQQGFSTCLYSAGMDLSTGAASLATVSSSLIAPMATRALNPVLPLKEASSVL